MGHEENMGIVKIDKPVYLRHYELFIHLSHSYYTLSIPYAQVFVYCVPVCLFHQYHISLLTYARSQHKADMSMFYMEHKLCGIK